MNTQPAFGFKELITHMVGDMARSISERNGESRDAQFVRSQAAVNMIMGFLPRDVIEIMLAGHCVMFHEIMNETIQMTLRGEDDATRRGTRNNLIALDKAFRGNLDRLERYQMRAAEGRRDEAEPRTEVEIANQDPPPAKDAAREAVTPVRNQAAAAETPNGPYPATSEMTPIRMTTAQANVEVSTSRGDPEPPAARYPDPTIPYLPSAEAVAACRANPEAMAALDAGDPGRFARAMGLEIPADDYLDAAARDGSPFYLQASGTKPPFSDRRPDRPASEGATF